MDPEQALDMSLDDVVQLDKAPVGEGEEQALETITVAKRIYCGNLSYRTSWQTLKDHFRSVGNVVFAEVLMEGNHRSKGCGIVEYESPKEAARAIMELHDTMLDGRKILVREDREDFDLKRRGPGGGNPRGPRPPRPPRNTGGTPGVPGKRVFVNNLAWESTWQDLKDHFRAAGTVVFADVLRDGERSKGCGIVEFETEEEAAKAIAELSNSELHGRPIGVREDREERR